MDTNHRIREASEIGIYSEVSGLRYPEMVGGVPGGLNQKIGSKRKALHKSSGKSQLGLMGYLEG
jgi:hypothetical protein